MAAPTTRSSLRLAQISPAHPPLHSTSSSRQPSPELGDPFFLQQQPSCTNSQRPKRKSAGKKHTDPEFVDSNLIDDPEELDDMGRESDPTTTDDESRSRKKNNKKKSKKRKRSPSPPPPPLSPVHSDVEEIASEDEMETRTSQVFSPTIASPGMVSLTFNVPKGFEGPFVVQFDPSMFSNASPCAMESNRSSAPKSKRVVARESTSPAPNTDSATGFMDLPPELRNKVYRLLFVVKDEFKFWLPDNFCRSSALLSTNKQICEEGASILYGENSFCFERSRHMRGQYWAAQRKEIGYKDMLRFFRDIGQRNLSFIRKLSITFEDANPSSTPHEYDPEGRRFVNDEHLVDCLRMVARTGKLKALRLSFQGRRRILNSDHRFIEVLKSISTDKLDIIPNPRYAYHSSFSKIDWQLEADLKKHLVRKEKLYLS